jgi:hypothetical protein
MVFSDAESRCNSKSERIPKLPYDSLPKLNPKLWLQVVLWLFLSWSYGNSP